MNDYVPASSLGWLDFDSAASERVATLLRSLDEPATLDVLGLGTVRDAFADMLTPGTSTVQTRLRYFIFLAWIFKRLKDEKVRAADFTRRLRDDEAQLIDCLRHLGPDQRVIGSVAGRALKRMPSDIYWGSMEAWGIRRFPLSIAEYGQQLAAREQPPIKLDDDGNVTSPSRAMWADLPPAPDDFLDSKICFKLEPEEASVLVDGIRQRHPYTLVAVLSGRPDLAIDDVDFPWLLPREPALPERLVEVLRHARCFSELTLGPRIVYNLLVSRHARNTLDWDTEEREDGQVRKLRDWASLVETRRGDLHAWVGASKEFRQLLSGYNVAPATLHFWDDIARRAVNDPTGFAENEEVHRRIRERERRLKSRRARLSHRAALETGGLPTAVDQLDYRWAITKSYLKDLAEAQRTA